MEINIEETELFPYYKILEVIKIYDIIDEISYHIPNIRIFDDKNETINFIINNKIS